MEKESLIAVLLVVMILASAIQTYQVVTLQNAMGSAKSIGVAVTGATTTGATSAVTQPASSSGGVGGC